MGIDKPVRYAFVNVPDVSVEEIKEFVSLLQDVSVSFNWDVLPFRLVFVGGEKWETISREELLERLNLAVK